MSEVSYYSHALKAGQKFYRQRLLTGESPNLQVLDQLLPGMKSYTGIDLGLNNIPIERVVGTLTQGRSDSFAGNFMPLAKEGSEFATKWANLAESHEREGIREPVLLYEYMNRYYVQEGNKRISVLKFFGAVTVSATVRRILPEKSDDPKVVAYYAYLDFNKSTGINFLEFSKPEDYTEFVSIMGKVPGETWDDENLRKIRAMYYRFSRVFLANGGDRLKVSASDAMLACLRVYGFSYLYELSEYELKKTLPKLWKEIELQQEDSKIKLKLEPAEEETSQKQSMLTKLLGQKRLKAAFLYQKERKGSSWVVGHELGRAQVDQNMAGKVETALYYCDDEEDVETILKQAIDEGANVIFATSAEMLPACLKAAVDAPDVNILNCSLNKPHRYVRVYYPRMYEAKFVAGAVAGILCENHKVGYVCKYPVYGSIAEINAFARGLQMTDPEAKLYLEWCSIEGGTDAPNRLMDQDVKLISMRDYQGEDDGMHRMYGLEQVVDGKLTPVVLPVLNWGVYYQWILNSILNGTYKSEDEKTSRSLNYYWGMSSEVVQLLFAERLPKGVRYMGELLARSIADGVCKPFFDPGKDENGRTVWKPIDRTISVEDILEMDWLEENVVGRIPAYEELNEQAQRLVDKIGIPVARKAGTREVIGVTTKGDAPIKSVESGEAVIIAEEE